MKAVVKCGMGTCLGIPGTFLREGPQGQNIFITVLTYCLSFSFSFSRYSVEFSKGCLKCSITIDSIQMQIRDVAAVINHTLRDLQKSVPLFLRKCSFF